MLAGVCWDDVGVVLSVDGVPFVYSIIASVSVISSLMSVFSWLVCAVV